jgi:hypothetical protein
VLTPALTRPWSRPTCKSYCSAVWTLQTPHFVKLGSLTASTGRIVRTSVPLRVFPMPCRTTRRRTIVLFGGRDLTDTPLRDTWEHTETDPPPPPINVSSITLIPTAASPGDQVTANISLTSPAQAGSRVELSWERQGDTTQTVLSVSPLHEGDTALSITFAAPQVGGGGGGGGGPIQIFARTVNSAQFASATLHVHP